MLNPIEKLKVAIPHLNRDWNHCNVFLSVLGVVATSKYSLGLIINCSAAACSFCYGIQSDNVNMEESTMNHHSFLCYNDIGKHWDSSKPLGQGSFIVFPEHFKCHSISGWRAE